MLRRHCKFVLAPCNAGRRFCATVAVPPPSPVTTITVAHRTVHIKRDDLIYREHFPGNKYRKLWKLMMQLEAPSNLEHKPSTIVTWGGTQSNAMLACAHLAHNYGLRLTYFSRRVSATARSLAFGNLAESLRLGMTLHESADPERDAIEFARKQGKNAIYIPRGGASEDAEVGIKQLAIEINDYFSRLCTTCDKHQIAVLVPSGTGTTAYFLQKHLHLLSQDQPFSYQVYTTPAATTGNVLLDDINRLFQPKCREHMPRILETSNLIRFAEPKRELLSVYRLLKDNKGVEIDLIYGAKMWKAMFEHWNELVENYKHIMYVHTGGTSGNATQLLRYADLGIGTNG